MSWARTAYGLAPWAAGEIPNEANPGEGSIPPPIPDATSTYVYLTQTGVGPWAMRSWGGVQFTTANPGGGISVAPDPENGVMKLWVWWPDATRLQLTRIDQKGARTPVRGGSPFRVTTPTRRNYATNPSVEAGLNGYVPGTGTPVLSQIARTDEPTAGQFAWRATVAGAGTNEVTIPHSLPVGQVTIALDLRYSALPTGATITLGWNDAAGGALTASSVALTASQLSASLHQFSRHAVTLTPPVAAATTGSLKLNTAGMPAGGEMDGDRVLAEVGVTAGDYFDGGYLGGTWSGVTGLSVSVLAPVQMVSDGECPLDVPVTYEVHKPGLTGGRVQAPAALLESLGQTWLTHPVTPGAPIRVDLRGVPSREHGIDQGVFWPMDRPRPVVITGAERRAPTGTIAINAISVAERDALMEKFRDASPVLLRTPADYHLGTAGTWYSLGTLSEDREGRKAWQDAWLLTAPYFEVDPPDPALAS